jgi:hypothetical protein
MTEDELFDLGLPEECYYVATVREDGAVPMAKKAQHDRIFFDVTDARFYITLLNIDYPGTGFCVVKALIIPVKIEG